MGADDDSSPEAVVTLTEFLLARIADDEAAAQRPGGKQWDYEANRSQPNGSLGSVWDGAGQAAALHGSRWSGQHIARHDPARILAECEAKRRIVERADATAVCGDHHEIADADCPGCCAAEAVTTADGYVLADLATVYADHPDYREEWRDA